MAAIDQIVKVNITQQTAAVSQASFSIPLIIGPTVPTSGPVAQVYFEPSGLLANGYTTSSPEYIYALELFDQPLTPTEFVVGQRTAAVAQVDTFAVNTIVASHVYQFTMAGLIVSYTAGGSETQQSILEGLLADIATVFPTGNPVSGAVSGSGAGALLTLTSVTPGAGVSYSAIDADLTHVAATANKGIANDLAAIIAVNNLWYGAILCSNVDYDILQLAAAIQALKKIFIAASNDSAIATSATTDIMSVMKALSYSRSGLVFSPLNYNTGIEAGWMGGQLPAVPGSNNWAFKTVIGAQPDSLSDNQVAILIGDPIAGVQGKNANIYQTVGGQDITQMGTMASGQFIDITIGVDWLESTIQSNVFTALTQAAKIPYTDAGTTVLISAVKAAIDLGVANGLIDGASPITISAAPVLSVPQSQRALRIAPTITFSCRLQGAFNAVIVNGTVTV